MTQPLPRSIKKPRHRTQTAEERRQRSAIAGRRELRSGYAGTAETRQFNTGTGVGEGRTVRSETSADGDINVSGAPIIYSPTSYSVTDSLGSFTERVMPGALSHLLADTDTRFLVNHSHDALPLARTAAGTMTLKDTPSALTFDAKLDSRMTQARDLAVALERGDISAMSIGFRVAPGGDSWDDQMTSRTIFRFQALEEISAVCFPCSPETYIETASPNHDDAPWGPSMGDGTVGGGTAGTQDGSRSAALRLELDLLKLKHRPRAKPRPRQFDPYHGVR